MGQMRHGLFVGYWREPARGRELIPLAACWPIRSCDPPKALRASGT
jgi:hypothetical protein